LNPKSDDEDRSKDRGVTSMKLWDRLAGVVAGLGTDAQLSGSGQIGVLLSRLASLSHDDNADGILDCEDYRAMFAPDHQAAFTVGVIALSAKMAKADGVVTRDEVRVFQEMFRVTPGAMKDVSRIFNLAKEDAAGYESYAEQLASLLNENRRLLEDVLEGLFQIALADGVLHANEEQVLANIAKLFGFTDAEFVAIKACQLNSGPDHPYEILGVRPEIDNETLKAHYSKLVADHDPDAMIARGVPPEFLSIATRKIAVLTAAYETVAEERNLTL
jgi:DnaJ like chaperone protein